MNIDKLFLEKKLLEKEIHYFIGKKHLRKAEANPELVQSHLKKARHNLEFYRINKRQRTFNDWLIVVLYYSLYHAALALLTHKHYFSKNHHATLLVLIKEYPITKDEATLLHELSISKEDAELYTKLKEDRHGASYTTDLKFSDKAIETYESKVLDFINKAEDLISKS
jgi:uncharacterized protein (UPF0332 family)